ncbi:MAG TPA: hypothetical protein VN750_12505 [Steroidobacteraceae bacterium]|nr:hypothetical protein [Steroidobacteraceae bacterium]
MSAGEGIWGEVASLTDDLQRIVTGMPGDDLTAGYRMSEEARAALERARPLLEQALGLIEAVQDRESRRYDAYCEEAEKAPRVIALKVLDGGRRPPRQV